MNPGTGSTDIAARGTPLRREPPPMRPVVLAHREYRSPTLVRLRLEGDALEGLHSAEPASSVRLLLPPPGVGPGDTLELPTWNGNEYLDSAGERVPIRTLTPLVRSPVTLRRGDPLGVEVVLHGQGGPLADWARAAEVGTPAAVSGTARGYSVPPTARHILVLGDESAIPAVATVLESVGDDVEVEALIELSPGAEPVTMPGPVSWVERTAEEAPGDRMVATAQEHLDRLRAEDATAIWASGNAAGVQRIRKLLAAADVPRTRQQIRGYWK